jgi:uncharacterized membrane protein
MILRLFVFFVLCLVFPSVVAAQDVIVVPHEGAASSSGSRGASDSAAIVPDSFPKDEYVKARVLTVVREGSEESGGYKTEYQVLSMKLLDGADVGNAVEVTQRQLSGQSSIQKVKKGDVVVLVKSVMGGERLYMIADRYRLQPVSILLAVFFILVVVFGRWKGLFSIVGLVVGILIIVNFIVPRIVKGENPFWVTLVGILLIAVTSLYLAHGFTRRTTIALVSTMLTLGLSILLATWAVDLTMLTGVGSEEAFYLQVGPLGMLNLKGLLLGGILIGTLGVLDDITTSQCAAVDEISKANKELGFKELYRRGLNVGHEHIASLVNTLFLAYAGSSLPLFLLLMQNTSGVPLWMTLNSEQFVEEIVRTVVGSIALILGVPISTLLAAWFFGRESERARPVAHIGHTHAH